MKKTWLLAACGIAMLVTGARADEGMWLPSLIGDRIGDMKKKRFRLEASDIYDVDRASMKDAIVMFGRGCTGELISPEGLLVTNHHCGYGQIQRHSSVENNILANGFWAMDRSEELPNPGLTVTFLVRMEDVTDMVLAGCEGLMEGSERDSLIARNRREVIEMAVEGAHYKASVSKVYYGNQYYLYVNEVFEDVRLVGAPPSAIGNFGRVTDNWMWPRHTGDFSLFRVYAGPDNKPAPYSKDNVPYVPKKYFPVSTAGVSAGDFTMVYGFPGSTQQFITSHAVDYILNHSNPAKIALRTARLGIIEDHWRDSEELRIAYAAKHSGIANSWKKWQGESLGLERLGTIEKKRAQERLFEAWAAGRPEYEGITERFADLYGRLFPYAYTRDCYNESLKVVELMSFAALLDGPTVKPGEALPDAAVNFYQDYSPAIDRQTGRYLFEAYTQGVEPRFVPEVLRREDLLADGGYLDGVYDGTAILDRAAVERALTDSVSWARFLSEDAAVELYRQLDGFIVQEVTGPYDRLTGELGSLYRLWVRGRLDMAADWGKRADLFPDANLTLRVAYGHVAGYGPEDAVWFRHFSTTDGILQKHRVGYEDYDLPEDYLSLLRGGDFGPWKVGRTVPVNFLATNHTTGGNSGSPVLNADGELVGVNFDRTWLSTMSDIEFDTAMCRNISLDVRYMLFVIDKVGGASYLFDEMDLR